MHAIEFTNVVLPSEGWRCAIVYDKKKVIAQQFFATNQELVSYINAQDQFGRTAFFACATFKEPRNDPRATPRAQRRLGRTHHNVHSAQALWLDIDTRESKPKATYADRAEAAAAVIAFCGVVGIPLPLWVSSGGGIHCYWPLDVALEPATWRHLADAFKLAVAENNLAADPSRTADITSVLRLPGSTHRGLGRVVECNESAGPYQFSQFEHLLTEDVHAHEAPNAEPQSIDCPDYLARRKPDRMCRATFVPSERGASFSVPIADECGHVGTMRASRGDIAEPHWYACLGVLGFTEDGDRFAHEWSAGHPGYSFDETEERLARVRELTGATTCDKFYGIDPAICRACPHFGKIKSPIALGYEHRSTETSSTVPASQFDIAAAHSPAQSATSTNSVALPPLPPHFKWSGATLVFVTENNGAPIEQLVSTYPIFLDAVNEGETRGDFSLTFKQWLPSKGWFEITVSAKQLLAPNGITELAARGANIHESNHFFRYVRAAIDKFYHEHKLKTRYDQYGWKANNTAFLYGTKIYTSQGEFEVAGSHELAIRNQWIGPGANAKGDTSCGVERWSNAANSLFAAGCEAQSVALLASFAAPLMRFLATDEGGAIISLVTRKSGTGKTTALAAVSSVWGDRKGLSLTNDDNKVTKWLSLGALGNLPVIHDEIQTRDPLAIRDFVINFTNGRDKMRATRDGEIKHSSSTWQTLLVSASNSSLVDALASTSKADAPAYRILELPLDIPDDLKVVFGDKLKNELILNAGYAGEVYARYIVQPDVIAFIKAALEKYVHDIWTKTHLSNEHRFWVRAVAVILVASLLVKQLDLIEFSVDRIADWLLAQIGAHGRADFKAPKEGNWPFEALSDFINVEAGNILVVPGPWKKNMFMKAIREPRGKIVARFEVSTNALIIARDAMREYATNNELPFREWTHLLEKRHVILNQDKRTLTAGTDLPGGQIPAIEINLKHHLMAGIETQIAVQGDPTNVTPMRGTR